MTSINRLKKVYYSPASDIIPSNSGISGPVMSGVPILRTSEPAPPGGAAATAIDDRILSYINEKITKKITSRAVQILLGLVSALLYIAVALITLARSGLMKVPASLRDNMLWKYIVKMPLFLLFIGALLSASMMSLFYKDPTKTNLTYWALGAIGVILLIYSLKNKRNCPQYLLTVTGGILIAFTILKLGYFKIEMEIVSSLFSYTLISSILLITINHFVFLPKCSASTSTSASMSGLAEGSIECINTDGENEIEYS